MTDAQLEELFAVWSASRPDLIHNVWDMTNSIQLLRFALQNGFLSAGPNSLSSVES